MMGDARYGHLCVGPNVAMERSPVAGTDDAAWSRTVAQVKYNAFVRAGRDPFDLVDGGVEDTPATAAAAAAVTGGGARGDVNGNGNGNGNDKGGGASGPVEEPGVSGGGGSGHTLRLFAHISICNHSCRPNAAVSVSNDLVTLYSLRTIRPGGELKFSVVHQTLVGNIVT